MFKTNEWYTYENEAFIKTFYCIDIDGDHLMYNSKQGFSLILCRKATGEEIKQAKKDLKTDEKKK
jgi:hypothetical protein